jgi:hypothetical protein
MTDKGLLLKSQVTLDRSQWGVGYDQYNEGEGNDAKVVLIEKDVLLTINILAVPA